jgi:hypothetical protein
MVFNHEELASCGLSHGTGSLCCGCSECHCFDCYCKKTYHERGFVDE